MDGEVRAGVLYIQKGSGLVKKFQKKYVALHRRSQHGSARLEVFDNKDAYDKRFKGAKKHLITLDSCATINRNPGPEGKKNEYQIQLTFESNKEQIFQADSEEELELWYACLSSVIFGGGGLTDNVIYQEYEQDGYDVVIKRNEIAKKLELSGLYTLVVSGADIELRDKETKREIYKWPLDRLRKYGRDKQEFSLEAGRRCPSGPGMFFFITDHYNEIFQDVDKKVRNLAKNRDIRDRATSVSSVKEGRSPTFNGPESPFLLSPAPSSPFPSKESEYDNPLDELRRPAPAAAEPIYNDPLDSGQPSVKPKDKKAPKLTGPPKPDRAQPKKSGGILGGKKDKKKKAGAKNLPPPPGHIPEATYSTAMPIAGAIPTADNGEYGQLNFEGTKRSSNTSGDDNQYDSLIVFNNSTSRMSDDSEYATAESLNPRFSNLSTGSGDGLYDHVKRS